MKDNPSRSVRILLEDWATAVKGTDYPPPPNYDGPDVEISSIVEHTDYVKSGACFVARVRTGTDGHPFIGRAIQQGASTILGQYEVEDLGIDLGNIPYLKVEDTAVAEAWLSAAWYGFPSRKLVMIGVTGTDGKSTTVNLIYQILKSAGIKAGMLSTIKATIGDTDEHLALHVTTPEAPVIQGYLRRMVDAGLSHCVLEATSHGLAQDRVGAIEFDIAVVTNITHEHLDYHGDYDRYLAAKVKLFENLGLAAVLNKDDTSYGRLVQVPAPRRIDYSLKGQADVSASNLVYGPANTRFKLHLPPAGSDGSEGASRTIIANLVGEFNVYNMLAAAAAAHAAGIEADAIKDGLESVTTLIGRMQTIDRGQPFQVVVDFAHTPNALKRAIEAARRMSDGRIITVFGSAGKRDVEKRFLMAEVSAIQADLTVLTAEDPRTESLDEILSTMAEGCQRQGAVEGKTFWRIPDRGQAIYFALSLAKNNDLVLICGKGHEKSMCFGTIEYPWDDIDATRTALVAYLSGRPMPNLGLPTFDLP
jgi:UDP-N-acetylmuramoyl-L-alanyl-D-glutamate--2,6-diaminopimelate ligase